MSLQSHLAMRHLVSMLHLFFVDAGPSELMAAHLAKNRATTFKLFSVEGAPALEIFQKYNLPLENSTLLQESVTPLLESIDKNSIIICSTSWQTTLHFQIFEQVKNLPIYVLLDHWVGYDKRMLFEGVNYTSKVSGFLVEDSYAYKEAQKHQLTPTIALKNNYLEGIKSAFTPLQKSQTLLFLSEPTREVALKSYGDASYWGFDEYSALEDIVKYFSFFKCKELVIRLHPSDKKDKYDDFIAKYKNVSVELPHSVAMFDSLAKAKVVIGFDTYALYIAEVLGLQAISYLPSHNRSCSLPITNKIKSLDDITSLKQSHFFSDEDFGENFTTFLEGIEK